MNSHAPRVKNIVRDNTSQALELEIKMSTSMNVKNANPQSSGKVTMRANTEPTHASGV